MLAAFNGRLEIFSYLKEKSPNFIIPKSNSTAVLHLAISIRDV
jgi:hypothetical protein